MKKYIITTAIALGAIATQSANAQVKIGFVNMDIVLDTMPQRDTFDAAVTAYTQQLSTELQQQEAELQRKQEEFQKLSQQPQTAQTQQRLENMQGIVEGLYRGYQMEQQSAQEKLQQQKIALLMPINDYIKKQIAEIAKKKGYTHILSSSENNLYYAENNNDDVTADVVKILFLNAPKVAPKKATVPAPQMRKP